MIAAVIPARDEEARIGSAVAALRSEGVRRILVLANDCTDATARHASAAGAEVAERGRLAHGVGEARALGCAEALGRWPETDMLVATDADGRVGRGCILALRRALARADAAMGRLVLDPRELAALPPDVIAVQHLEEERGTLLAELGSVFVPRPHDPLPRHLHRAGGLMAFRPAAYLGVGGFRPLPCHEDRDIAARLSLAGFRTAHPWAATVTVSCRMTGRSPEGMAATIAARAGSDLAARAARLADQCARLDCLVRAMRRDPDAAASALSDLVQRRAPQRMATGSVPTLDEAEGCRASRGSVAERGECARVVPVLPLEARPAAVPEPCSETPGERP